MRGLLKGENIGVQNHLAVINIGGFDDQQTRLWNVKDLRPAVSYQLNGADAGETYFNGFIFSPISSRDGSYIHPLYDGFGERSIEQDWQLYLNYLFEKETNLHALESLASTKLDIWIGLPYPLIGDTIFGTAGTGVDMAFDSTATRLTALSWWYKQFVTKWHATGFTKLKLQGFYWIKEVLSESDEELIQQINNQIHADGYKTMWLPNYGGFGAMKPWKGDHLKFDVTAVNTNYYGNTMMGTEWINHACMFSNVFGCGLQLNIGKGWTFSPYHVYDFLNFGLPTRNNYINDHLLVFSFYNLTFKEFAESSPAEYQQIRHFMKKQYVDQSYPGRAY
ncbi:DUF4855 domain-containing protein [Alkalicoccobacillus plakortidis]|uniref:DUF4855 domain-containing protein n=1 Tax=Alkalicoccobacillus plakortidis TaxID=444060 RepID=A0ABT0XGM3_9BACI|nr:DUF4855 domain-containing protein [Alkalicoccobacillus plakortidis]MCM2675032.1 DUF4855 domain-containing protein [Alkalicoccobacillus plakortidis]